MFEGLIRLFFWRNQTMRFRLSLGATLLAVAAMTADPAFAFDEARNPKKGLLHGTICVENAGAFIIETSFYIANGEANWANRSTKTGAYPVMQTRCIDFLENDDYVKIDVHVVAGVGKSCYVNNLFARAGKTITAKIHGTTLINQLDCPN